MSPSLTLAFAGTPAFAVYALKALLATSHRVAVVYTQPDRPAGRGRTLKASPVKQCALDAGLPIEQPLSLRTDDAAAKLASHHVDAMVVVAYGLLLPPAILAVPRLGCLNIHASLLPRWRGAAPIQRALLAGDRETGVAIMRMEEGLDTGPVYLQRRTGIGERDTAASLHDRLAVLGAEAMTEALDALASGELQPVPQPGAGATYARKILKEEAVIDWSGPAVRIDRQVRAFNPVPGAQTLWRGQPLKIWEAWPVPRDTGIQPGSVVAADADGIVVAAGEGALRITRLQLAGRNATSAADFARAHRPTGDLLGPVPADPA